MVNKINTAFRSMSLLPPSWKFACASSRGACRHHGDSIRTTRRWSWDGNCVRGGRWLHCRLGWAICNRGRARAGTIFGKHSLLMAGSLCFRSCLHRTALISLIIRSRWPSPCCSSAVVINVVCPTKIVFAAFPSCWQSPLVVFKRCEYTTSVISAATVHAVWRNSRRRGGRLRVTVWEMDAGRAITGLQV